MREGNAFGYICLFVCMCVYVNVNTYAIDKIRYETVY